MQIRKWVCLHCQIHNCIILSTSVNWHRSIIDHYYCCCCCSFILVTVYLSIYHQSINIIVGISFLFFSTTKTVKQQRSILRDKLLFEAVFSTVMMIQMWSFRGIFGDVCSRSGLPPVMFYHLCTLQPSMNIDPIWHQWEYKTGLVLGEKQLRKDWINDRSGIVGNQNGLNWSRD